MIVSHCVQLQLLKLSPGQRMNALCEWEYSRHRSWPAQLYWTTMIFIVMTGDVDRDVYALDVRHWHPKHIIKSIIFSLYSFSHLLRGVRFQYRISTKQQKSLAENETKTSILFVAFVISCFFLRLGVSFVFHFTDVCECVLDVWRSVACLNTFRVNTRDECVCVHLRMRTNGRKKRNDNQ